MENIGIRIGELVDYLMISHNEFGDRCELTGGTSIIKGYINNDLKPSHETITKILNRYPVREEWLVLGKGKMWEKDYFAQRFFSMSEETNSPSEKFLFLLKVLELNKSQMAKKLNVARSTVNQIALGDIKMVSKNIATKLYNTFYFIPKGWFDV